MDDAKPWYLSRTIWASLVTVALSAAGLLGFSVGEVDGAEATDAILRALTAAAGLVALVGRVVAKSRIG